MSNIEMYLGAALMISEALAILPFFKSNSILQLIINCLKKAKEIIIK